MKVHTENMDKELLVEKNKTLTECLKSNTRKKVQKRKKENQDTKEDDTVISDYMKKVNAKRQRNNDKMKSLGFKKTPPKTDSRSRRQSGRSQKSTPTDQNMAKKDISPGTKSPKTKLRTTAKTVLKKPRTIFTDYDIKIKCKCDHQDFTGYKEETDKRYFSNEMELFGTRCANCTVLFAGMPDKNEVCYVPSTSQVTYFCPGRIKYNCRHAYCHTCYIQATEKCGRSRRRK